MPKVNLEELEKQTAKEEASINKIISKQVGDKTVFKGPILDEWFSDYGECQSENQSAALQASYKEQGLDEFGRTPEQVALAAEKAKLFKKKQELLDKAAEIDVEIAGLTEEDFKKGKKK